MRSKTENKLSEGCSLLDLSVVNARERNCTLRQRQRIRICSLNADLSGYHRHP